VSVKIGHIEPLSDAAEQAVRKAVVSKVEANPERYLAEYTRQFGNILNADNAATLFPEYNANPAKYRVAVHPAAQWIRDELFRRILATPAVKGKNRVVFTAGGNAAGKSTAVAFTRAAEWAHAILDSTFSNAEHARRLIADALREGRAISILYTNRPLRDALNAMIERAGSVGRVVTIDQLINSQRAAADTVRGLWKDFAQDPRFFFTFLHNNADGNTIEIGLEAVIPQDYTESRRNLHELLDAEYQAGRISETVYRRVGGPGGERGKPSAGEGGGSQSGGGPEPPAGTEASGPNNS
jgi:hypothetical protein